MRKLATWDDNRIPAVRDPMWERIVPPLFAYLATPRTIDEILEWGFRDERSTARINNMLAYLSFNGRARYDKPSARWMRGSDRQSCLESWGCGQAGPR
jgi:hypothetical protein